MRLSNLTRDEKFGENQSRKIELSLYTFTFNEKTRESPVLVGEKYKEKVTKNGKNGAVVQFTQPFRYFIQLSPGEVV